MRDKGDLDYNRREDISQAIDAIAAVLERTNAYIDHAERIEAVTALKSQVEDWRNHRVEAFGELLLHGTFTVIKGDGMNSEREVRLLGQDYPSISMPCPKAVQNHASISANKTSQYKMYLFEKILLCCKELGPKQMAKMKYRAVQPTDKKGRPRMALKGRIFMQNVSDVVYLSRVGTLGFPALEIKLLKDRLVTPYTGSYSLQIYWRGDEAIEYFLIRCPTEEVGKRWLTQIDIQRSACQDQLRRITGESLSDSEFAYMRDQGVLENPYRNEDFEDGPDQSNFAASRNASSTSLRTRSTTSESAVQSPQAFGRSSQSKYPPGPFGAPLTLRTNHLPNAVASPSERNGSSYFSPTIDSPMSTRTSSSSGMFGFPRQMTPLNGWHGEDSNRYTAPAYMRPVAEDGVHDPYEPDPRNGRVLPSPALPPHPASLNQTRNRSASSPVIDLANRRAGVTPPPIPNAPSQLSRNAAIMHHNPNNLPHHGHGASSMSSQTSQHMHSTQHGYENMRSESATMSPPLDLKKVPTSELSSPTQLRVKVKIPSEGSSFVLVVAYNISCQALKDRIDSKLQRQCKQSLASAALVLKYVYDGEFVSLQTDEDVQTAFETWKDDINQPLVQGQYGEVQLFCHPR